MTAHGPGQAATTWRLRSFGGHEVPEVQVETVPGVVIVFVVGLVSTVLSLSVVWRGDVSPRPSSLGACKYCDARDLCRRPAVMPEATEDDG